MGKLIPDKKVREELGGISVMTQWRLEHNPAANYPKAYWVGRRKFRDEEDVAEYRLSLTDPRDTAA